MSNSTMGAQTRAAVCALALVVAALAAPAVAQADTNASCDVYEFKANNGGTGVDKGLAPLAGKLKKPPFSTWNSFQLIATHQLSVERGGSSEMKIATGKMKVELLDISARAGKKPRLRLAVMLLDNSGKQQTAVTSTVDSGDPWLIGGKALPSEPQSTYFVGIACSVK